MQKTICFLLTNTYIQLYFVMYLQLSMNDIKTLGNKQLGVYNEIIRKKLNDLKIDILEDINDIV